MPTQGTRLIDFPVKGVFRVTQFSSSKSFGLLTKPYKRSPSKRCLQSHTLYSQWTIVTTFTIFAEKSGSCCMEIGWRKNAARQFLKMWPRTTSRGFPRFRGWNEMLFPVTGCEGSQGDVKIHLLFTEQKLSLSIRTQSPSFFGDQQCYWPRNSTPLGAVFCRRSQRFISWEPFHIVAPEKEQCNRSVRVDCCPFRFLVYHVELLYMVNPSPGVIFHSCFPTIRIRSKIRVCGFLFQLPTHELTTFIPWFLWSVEKFSLALP